MIHLMLNRLEPKNVEAPIRNTERLRKPTWGTDTEAKHTCPGFPTQRAHAGKPVKV